MKKIFIYSVALAGVFAGCGKKEKSAEPVIVHDVFIVEKEFPVPAELKPILPDTIRRAVLDTLKFEDTFVVMKAVVAHDEKTGIGQVQKIELYKHGNNAIDVSANIGQPENEGTPEKPLSYSRVDVTFKNPASGSKSQTDSFTINGKGDIKDLK